MKSYIDYPCPGCQRALRVRAEYNGMLLRCKHCSSEFPFEAGSLQHPPFPPPHAPESHRSTPLEAATVSPPCVVLEEGLQRAVSREREQFQTKNQELGRSLTESLATHAASPGGPAKALREAAANWEAERLALELQWEEEHQEFVHEAEQQLVEQRARAAADWQLFREEMEVVQTQFNQERSKLESEVAGLRQDSEALRQERDRLATDRTTEQQRLERALAEEKAHADADRQLWQEQTAAAQAQFNEERGKLESDLARLREDADGLRQAVDRLANDRSTEQQHLERALAEEKARADADRQLWQQQLETAQTQFNEERAKLESELTRSRQDAEALRQEHDRLATDRSTEHQRLEATLAEEKARAAADQQLLKEQLEAAQAQFDQGRSNVKSELARLRQEVDVLRQEGDRLAIDRSTEHQRLEATLAEERDRAAANKQELQEKLGVLRQRFDRERATFQSELEQAHTQAECARLQQDQLSRQVEILTQERDQHAADRAEIDTTRQKAAAHAQAEIARLGQALEQAQQNEEALARRSRDLTEQLQALRTECDQLRSADHEQQRRFAEVQRELEVVRAAATIEQEKLKFTLADEQTRWATDRQKWQAEQKAAQHQFDQDRSSLRLELQRLSQEANALRRERDELAACRTQVEGRVRGKEEELRTEMASLTRDLEAAQQLLEAGARNNQGLAEQIQKLRAERDAEAMQQPELAGLRQELEATRANGKKERERIMLALTQQQAWAAGERKKWQEESEALRRQFDQDRAVLRNEIESLRQQGAGLQQERDATLGQLHALNEDWSRLAAQREQLDSSRQDQEQRSHEELLRLKQALEQAVQKEEATARYNQELTELVRTLQGNVEPDLSGFQKELEAVRMERERMEQTLAEEQKRNGADRQKWQVEMEEARRQFDQDRAALEAAAVWARQESTHFRQVLRTMGVTGL